MTQLARSSVSASSRLECRNRPFIISVVIPLFAVSLPVADLAFIDAFIDRPMLQRPARIGVLAGSAFAAGVGSLVLWGALR